MLQQNPDQSKTENRLGKKYTIMSIKYKTNNLFYLFFSKFLAMLEKYEFLLTHK